MKTEYKKRGLIVILLVALASGLTVLLVYRAGQSLPDTQLPGPAPTPDTLFYATKPTYPFWISEETRERKKEEWQADLQTRVQTLYECSDCLVFYEIVNPLFMQAFPQARLYEVGIRYECTEFRENERCMNRMVSFKNKDYQMPDQFNELMHEAGYELTDKNFDRFAYALVVVSVPTGVAMQPISCESKEIWEPTNSSESIPTEYYTYEIHCQLTYKNYSLVMKFPESVFEKWQFTWWYENINDEEGHYVNIRLDTHAQYFSEE